MTAPTCGAQKPSSVPSPFDWGLFTAVGVVAAAGGFVYAGGIPVITNILAALGFAATAATSTMGPAVLTAAFAGAAAIVLLVFYFALQPDGCIRSPPKEQLVCFSGIVEETSDTSSAAIAVLAPFAIPPSGIFTVVVKSIYWDLVSKDAFWVYCSKGGVSMLPCVIKSKSACGGKIGSMAGAAVGAIGGLILGYVAAAAVGGVIGCAATGPLLYLICLLVVLLVAAIVAAVVTYVGAMIGGWVGQGIGAVGADPVGDAWEGLDRGAIVTVRGNWVTNPDIGNNEIYYVTELHRNGMADPKASFTTADADATAADDCSPVSSPIG